MLTTLSIRDFRNIARADLSIPPYGLAIVGENGQGKTNFLEAIYYFHALRSMRGARDHDLIRFGAPAFHVTAHATTNASHTLSVAFERARRQKKIVIDGAEPARMSNALGMLPSALLSPRDIELVMGAPAERRRFLDILLALSSPPYLAALQSYRAALARRNSVLRQYLYAPGKHQPARTAEEMAAVWEPALAEHGSVLLQYRARWIAQHTHRFAELCEIMGERATVTMHYVSGVHESADDASDSRALWHDRLREQLERRRPLDLKRGATHVGPHRDEIALKLEGRELRVFGSAGQHRTVALALRLLECATLSAARGHPPLLLLDDPFAELDPRRSARILELLKEEHAGQAILAVPRAADIPAEFTRLERWHVANGMLARHERLAGSAA